MTSSHEAEASDTDGLGGDGGDGAQWSDRRVLGRALKLLVLLGPILASVGFVVVASRIVPRPQQWYGVAGWWIGLTVLSTVVLRSVERVMRRVLPLAALFRLSLVFPDRAPSRFKVAMRTNTLRQLQRSLEADELEQEDFQEAAERLVALAGALNAHDRATRGHTERVRAYTLMIGEELRLPKADLNRLHWAGLVHDIGKLEVPPSILNKPGRPDPDEWAILSNHPAAAVRLIEPLRPWLGEWADAASQHHERWDGKGYPFGLAGEEISLSGRIVAVADAFDVMTSVRSYKKAMTPEAARAELLRNAGTQFDANVVRAFLNISVGKLRLVMGPLSWLAQAPVLGNVPLGASAVSATSSLVSVGIAMAAGLAAADGPTPSPIPPPVAAVAVAGTDLPVARAITIAGLEDQRIELDESAIGAEPPTSIFVTSLPNHLRIDPASPSALIPERNWFGESVGEYQACWDDSCSVAQLRVDVQSVNDIPTAAADGATTPEAIPVTIDVLANDFDVEDDQPALIGVSMQSPTAGGTATLTSDGRLRFEPSDGFVGMVQLSYQIADSDGAVANGAVTVEVKAVNSPPRGADDNGAIEAGATETIDVLANDADDETETLPIVSSTPPTVGAVVFTANSVTASAGTPAPTPTSTASPATTPVTTPVTTPATTIPLPVPVSATPTARPDQRTTVEDSSWIDLDVLANDTSADGDLTNDTISIVGPPGRGTAQLVGQQLRYRPNSDANGPDTVTYRVCETTNKCDAAIVSVTIAARNDSPQFVDSGAINVSEDSGPRSIDSWATGISSGPPNEAAQHVGFTVTVNSPGIFASLPAVDAAGRLTFTPAADANGTATITVTAVDDGGTGNGGSDTSTPHTATITIAPINDAVTAADDSAILDEDDPAGVTIAVLANDTDADKDALNIVAVDTTNLNGGTVTNLGNGSLHYESDPNFNGVETFTYTVGDGNGSSAIATVTITVTPTPDAPVAVADAFSTPAGTARFVAAPGLIGNDYDHDSDTITISSTPVVGPTNGTLVLGTHGAFTYTPNSGFSGTDTFIYRLNDSTGRTATSTVTITIANGAPVAANDTATAVRGAAGPNIDVLANDTDINLDVTSVTISSAPTKGTATPQPNGTITYQPTPNAAGTDSFIYRVCDTDGLCATATVSITITTVNGQPVFAAGPDITVNATDPPYTHTGWATGIAFGSGNNAGQTLSFTVIAADPTLFSVQPSIDPSGTLTFTPSGIIGSTTITVQLSETGGAANVGNNPSGSQTALITLN